MTRLPLAVLLLLPAALAVFLLLPESLAWAEEDAKTLTQYADARRLVYEDDLPAAIELFGRVVREHPGSGVADDALYMIGWCWERRPDGEPRAIEAWVRFARRYGTSPWLDEAADGLNRLGAVESVRALLKERAAAGDSPLARRAADALAALGDASVLPSLRTRLAAGDRDAARALSRLGRPGADALANAALDEKRTEAERAAALEGFAHAVRTGKLDDKWVRSVLVTLEKTHPNRRAVRAIGSWGGDARNEPADKTGRAHDLDPAEQIARLERRVEGLKKQIEALERIVAELEKR